MNREKDISREERQLMTMLRSRPGIYVGSDSLYAVHLFIKGYELAARRRDLHDVRMIPDGFQEFVEEYYFLRHPCSMSWAAIILQQQPDDAAALRLFWELLDAYLEQIGCEPVPVLPGEALKSDELDGIFPVMPAHITRLAESYMRTFNGEPWWDRWDRKTASERMENICRGAGFSGFALWQNGSPVGAVLGRCEQYFDGKCFQLIELWVESRVQKQGWGRKLLNELTESLLRKNVRRMYLITMHGEQTEGFYKSCGFTTQDSMCVMQLRR